MTHYHAGQNMAGYMPMAEESYPFETFDDAKRSLIADMLNEADHMTESETIAENLTAEAGDLNLASGPEYLAYVETIESEHCIPTAYWIVPCDEDCAWSES